MPARSPGAARRSSSRSSGRPCPCATPWCRRRDSPRGSPPKPSRTPRRAAPNASSRPPRPSRCGSRRRPRPQRGSPESLRGARRPSRPSAVFGAPLRRPSWRGLSKRSTRTDVSRPTPACAQATRTSASTSSAPSSNRPGATRRRSSSRRARAIRRRHGRPGRTEDSPARPRRRSRSHVRPPRGSSLRLRPRPRRGRGMRGQCLARRPRQPPRRTPSRNPPASPPGSKRRRSQSPDRRAPRASPTVHPEPHTRRTGRRRSRTSPPSPPRPSLCAPRARGTRLRSRCRPRARVGRGPPRSDPVSSGPRPRWARLSASNHRGRRAAPTGPSWALRSRPVARLYDRARSPPRRGRTRRPRSARRGLSVHRNAGQRALAETPRPA